MSLTNEEKIAIVKKALSTPEGTAAIVYAMAPRSYWFDMEEGVLYDYLFYRKNKYEEYNSTPIETRWEILDIR